MQRKRLPFRGHTLAYCRLNFRNACLRCLDVAFSSLDLATHIELIIEMRGLQTLKTRDIGFQASLLYQTHVT